MPALYDRSIARILKVNHAGEYGAIRIYQAQLQVARHRFTDLVPFLEKTLADESDHCNKFRAAMPPRDTRPCLTLWFWSWGGYILGVITAMAGRNAVMVCTETVEDAVHHHMNDQIVFLADKDSELQRLIEIIRVEELEHLDFAAKRVRHSRLTKLAFKLIYATTEILIWLSTQGAASQMKRDLRGR